MKIIVKKVIVLLRVDFRGVKLLKMRYLNIINVTLNKKLQKSKNFKYVHKIWKIKKYFPLVIRLAILVTLPQYTDVGVLSN